MQLLKIAIHRFEEIAAIDPIGGLEMIDDIHDNEIKKTVLHISIENFAEGANNAKNIAELDRYLQWFWDNYKSIGDGAKIMKIATALVGTLDRLWVTMRTQNTPAKKRVQWWIQRMKSRLGKKKKAPRIVPEYIIPNRKLIG